MRKHLWIAATIISALALLGTAAGAANSGADPTSVGAESVRANVGSNVVTTVVAQSQLATEADKNDQTETETNDDDNPQISASTEAAPSGTSSTKPGFGCGDKNHEHSGPPGRPGATPPPGCDKGSSGAPSGSAGQSGAQGNSADHRNTSPSLNHPGKGKGK